MTAEVCVMNKFGVALAADSAVTRTGTSDPKIYQSADKLFLLSNSDPVAVMVYGSATFMGIPWETIIKLYRRKHGHQSRPKVLDHMRGLMSFLAKSRELFPEELQRAYLIADLRAYLKRLLSRLKKTIESKLAKESEVKEAEIRRLATKLVGKEFEEFQSAPTLEGLPKRHIDTVRKLFGPDISKTVEDTWGQVPLTKTAQKRLKALATEAAVKGQSSAYSGVVVAGFGSTEVFPAVASVVTDRVLANRTKYNGLDSTRIDHGNSATIIPFAQSEMVSTFMEGIDPQLRQFVERSLSTTFEDLANTLSGALGGSEASQAALQNALRPLTQNALGALQEKWREYQRKRHTDPIIDVVSILPKDELASLAESLVNLTVFRRHTSPDAETVGGPIDVAVITKGDGFVWIKRKHYFDPELNPRYIANLNSGETLWHNKKPSNRSKKS